MPSINLQFSDAHQLLRERRNEVASFFEDVLSRYVYSRIVKEGNAISVDANIFAADTQTLAVASFREKKVDPFIRVQTELNFELDGLNGIQIDVLLIVTPTIEQSGYWH